MIVGVDIQRVDRVRRLLEATVRARHKVFTSAEIVYCESRGVKRWQHYAARYAAKEATLKALGTGWRGELRFDEIEIRPGALGRPEHRFLGRTRELVARAGVENCAVSMSCDSQYGLASVILSMRLPAGTILQ